MKRLAALFLLALASVFPAFATSVLPMDLDQMVAASAVAFDGTCTGNRTGRDPVSNLIVTYTTFAVHDVLKGDVGATYEIKQIGGALPNGLQHHVEGVPRFAVGQEYVVLLPQASSGGFSSPVGLSQGQFTVTQTEKGATVSNGRDFREMTSTIPSEQLPGDLQTQTKRATGPVRQLDLSEFKQLVRNRAGPATRAPTGVAQ